MAGNSTVAAMTAASALDGSELFYVVQGGNDRKATATQIQTLSSELTIGSSPITGGTTTRILYDNAGVVGEYAQVPLAVGGTNANLTASNGGILYSTATAGAVLSGTATARQMLQSGASSAPAWSTTTWPATTTINRLLWSSAANVISDLATANSSILVTDGSGVPSLSTTLPAFTLGGTVSGGGQQLNNIIIGTSTPLAGSFTTLTASTSTTSPLLIGGTGTTSTLTLQPTSGVGTTNADMIFKVGNNGATEAMRILNSTFVGVNTASPATQFHVDAGTITVGQYATGGRVTLRRAAGTQGSPTQVGSGANVAVLDPQGLDDTSVYRSIGSIAFATEASVTSTSAPGRAVISTVPAGSLTPTERMRVDAPGNVIINTAAINTTATDGFLYIPTCAGAPTGVPTAYTGRIPMIYDTTNDQFWFYRSGWKQPKTPAAAAIITWQ